MNPLNVVAIHYLAEKIDWAEISGDDPKLQLPNIAVDYARLRQPDARTVYRDMGSTFQIVEELLYGSFVGDVYDYREDCQLGAAD